jgi:hypothetical protein
MDEEEEQEQELFSDVMVPIQEEARMQIPADLEDVFDDMEGPIVMYEDNRADILKSETETQDCDSAPWRNKGREC